MFDRLSEIPPDPLLMLIKLFAEDPRPEKVDLGVGVYMDDTGRPPILESVKMAQERRIEKEKSKSYESSAGDPSFRDLVQTFVMGEGHTALRDGRVTTLAAPGGSGALRLATNLVARANPGATIWVSDPTWDNHPSLLGYPGLNLKTYPYYDRATGGIRFGEMVDTLRAAETGDVVVLHAACHNPTGADLDPGSWKGLQEIFTGRGLIPLIDAAYLGLGNGVEEDAYGFRHLIEDLPEALVASSFSKNMGVYRERIGALHVLCHTRGDVAAAFSQSEQIVRSLYSTPPAHGEAIVAEILGAPDLFDLWQKELAGMRGRLNGLRAKFAAAMNEVFADRDFSFLAEHNGLFALLDLPPEKMQRLRTEFGVYATDSGRLNVAGLNDRNIAYAAKSIHTVFTS